MTTTTTSTEKSPPLVDVNDILFEIVSATDLPCGDRTSSDPYVVVYQLVTNDHSNSNSSSTTTTTTTTTVKEIEIHRTKIISKNTSPIWTIDTDCFFLFRLPPSTTTMNINSSSGDLENEDNDDDDLLLFVIYDYDTMGSNDILGRMKLTRTEIFEAISGNSHDNDNDSDDVDEERIECDLYDVLQTTKKKKKKKDDEEHDDDDDDIVIDEGSTTTTTTTATNRDLVTKSIKKKKKSMNQRHPKLNIRMRIATPEDKAFMTTLQKNSGDNNKKNNPKNTTPGVGVYADHVFVPPVIQKVDRFKKESRTCSSDSTVTEYRIKPYPDPNRPEEETKWMTSQQINDECYKPSTKWIETGTGTLGKLYFEILHCDQLPNMDTNVLGNSDKTDTYCCLMYEDTIVNSEVINDEISPRFMPWIQRAFIFHIQHPSSQLLLSVCDYDSMRRNDPIGRITIDITNLYANMEYTLTYPLYKSILDEERTTQGTITIRLLRQNISFRQAVITTLLEPPPTSTEYLNLVSMDDFQSAKYAACGEEDMTKLDTAAMKSYCNELEGYCNNIVWYIEQAIMTVLFWRGHYTVPMVHKITGYQMKLPIHSMIAFIMGITVVENFNLLVAYTFFAIAWFMLSTNEERNRNPSPWYQVPTYTEMMVSFVFGTSRTYNHSHANVLKVDDTIQSEIDKYEESRKELRDKQAKKKEEQKLRDSNLMAVYSKQEAEVNKEEGDVTKNTHFETKTSGGGGSAGLISSLNPLKPVLMPIQTILGTICRTVRGMKSFIVWDESIYAFILVNICILMGIPCLFIPWSFLLHWLLRILTWTLLGPWMKLVDIYIIQQLEDDDDDDPSKTNFMQQLEEQIEQRSIVLAARRRRIMMNKEDTMKLQALKRYMFGEYSIKNTPQMKAYRYSDIPMSNTSYGIPKTTTTIDDDQDAASSKVVVERKYGQTLIGDMIPLWGDKGDNAIVNAAKAAAKAEAAKAAAAKKANHNNNKSRGGGFLFGSGGSNKKKATSATTSATNGTTSTTTTKTKTKRSKNPLTNFFGKSKKK